MAKLNKKIQHSIKMNIETWLKRTAKNELIEKVEMEKWNNFSKFSKFTNKFKLSQIESTAYHDLETNYD